VSDVASILVIDADSAAAALLSLGMRRLGLSVSTVQTLRDGLCIVRSQPPSAIVTEQVLPDGYAISVLVQLRDVAPRVKTVILTRHASVSAAVLAIRSGAAGYLSKPAEAAEVATELGLLACGEVDPVAPGQEPVMTLEQVEWEYINRVMLSCGGNISEASRRLHMHRRSLQRKLARGGPSVPPPEPRERLSQGTPSPAIPKVSPCAPGEVLRSHSKSAPPT
jgi:two-component system response regulator RegA